MGWKTRLVAMFVAVAAWSLLVDAFYDHSWPGTDVRWWALYVAWFGGWCVVWIIGESLIRSRRGRREP